MGVWRPNARRFMLDRNRNGKQGARRAFSRSLAFRIIPSDLTRLALAGAQGPEIVTLTHLRDALPEDYTVFRGVHWTRQYRGYTLYGEIDFVVLIENEISAGLAPMTKNELVEQSSPLW